MPVHAVLPRSRKKDGERLIIEGIGYAGKISGGFPGNQREGYIERMKNDWILHMRNKRYSRMAAGD